MESKKNIVILGAGFGGITMTLKLEKMFSRLGLLKTHAITLIDKNYFHLYTPALYEIASIPKDEASAISLKSVISIPIDEIIANKAVVFIQDAVIRLDHEKKTIILGSGQEIAYDYCVVALGSETNYFNIPGLETNSLPLKQFTDALKIRNKIEALLTSKDKLAIVVGGAGASGVELIAEFSNFICALQRKLVKERQMCNVYLTLVEASPEILSGFSESFVAKTKTRLTDLGIEIKTGALITETTEDTIMLKDGRTIAYDLFIWTGGVKGSSALLSLGLPLTAKGNITVNEFLEAVSHVYAIGDAAGFIHPTTGKLLNWNVPVAESEARIVAKNITREIMGQKRVSFRPPLRYPFILAVGKKYALADLIICEAHGFFGWIIKLLVELRYLATILPLATALNLWYKAVRLYSSND